MLRPLHNPKLLRKRIKEVDNNRNTLPKMKPISQFDATKESVDKDYEFESKQYLFVTEHSEYFTGIFFDYSDEDEPSDVHITQFGRDGYRYDLDEVLSYILIDNCVVLP